MPTIEVVLASAGTGKTHRLAEIVASAVAEGRCAPEGVLAITYTRKAAAELVSRLRRRLLGAGLDMAAHRVRDGYIGTVHAVCHRLVAEHAFAAGLPAQLEPLTEAAAERLFAESLGSVMASWGGPIEGVAHRLGLDDWHDQVAGIVKAARRSGIGPGQLSDSAEASLAGYQALLEEATGDPAERDAKLAALWRQITPTARRVKPMGHPIGDSLRAIEMAYARRDRPPWGVELDVAVLLHRHGFRHPAMRDLALAVAGHRAHPRFHEDVRITIREVFALAARTLEVYDLDKRSAGVVDYDDMLDHALRVLGEESVVAAMGGRLQLVVVDELQDISPRQVAIVRRLSELSERAVWVGDAKQAIYRFQGADPRLMASVVDAAIDEGGKLERLAVCYRARRPLVALWSRWFTQSSALLEVDPDLGLEGYRIDGPELAGEPVVECWRYPLLGLKGRSASAEAREEHAIADGIEQLLADEPRVSVKGVPGQDEETRPVGAGDIAVLCPTNKQCERVAEALVRRGIPARVALPGLLQTAEARVAIAALSLATDPADQVAALDVAWLAEADGRDPDRWLAEVLGGKRVDGPRVEACRGLNPHLADRSPGEVFDAALGAVGLHERCLGWPSPRRRLANVEAMRAEVTAYEELCTARRTACTAAGLVRHLRRLRDRPRWQRGGTAKQAMPSDPDAVTVTTIHQSKGLEWPVVVVGYLDYRPPDNPFGVDVMSGEAEDRGARWVRWWPWPYRRRGTWARRRAVDETLTLKKRGDEAASTRRLRRDAEREQVRLTYVAMTRARDRLVLLAAQGTDGLLRTHRLDQLGTMRDDGDAVRLPWTGADMDAVGIGEHRWPCVVRRVRGFHQKSRGTWESLPWLALTPRDRPLAPDAIRPHQVVFDGGVIRHTASLSGAGLAVVRGAPMGAVGNAVHAFLAADYPGADEAARLARAEASVAAHGVADAVYAPALVDVGQGLWEHLEGRWPGATWHREWPLRWRIPTEAGDRLLVGEVDLIVALGDDRFVVVDHKTMARTDAAAFEAKLPAFCGQLAAYRAALQAATGGEVVALFVHLPVHGQLIEVEVPEDAFDRWLASTLDSADPDLDGLGGTPVDDHLDHVATAGAGLPEQLEGTTDGAEGDAVDEPSGLPGA